MRIFSGKSVLPALAVLAFYNINSCKKSDSEDATGVSVSSLSSLPDLSTLLSSDSSASSLNAVSGTPPLFAEIGDEDETVTQDNLEKYLSGPVDDLMTKITDGGTNWSTVKPLVKSFRQAQAKCQIMQDAARSLQELNDRTTSTCMMTKIGAAGAGTLDYKSGTEVVDGEFFTPVEQDVVRKIVMPAKGPITDQDSIFVNIQGTSTEDGVYDVKLTFCKDGKNKGSDSIRIVNATGTMTLSTIHSGTETHNDIERTFKSRAKVVGYLKEDGDKYIFDESKQKDMTIQNYMKEEGREESMQGAIAILGDSLSSILSMKGSFTHGGNTNTQSSKSFGQVQYSGSSFEDAVIYQGAGRRVGEMDDGTHDAVAADNSVAFEYNSSKTPAYTTISESDILTFVKAFDFEKNSILGESEPPTVETDELAKKACAQTPDSVYTMVSNDAAKEAKQTCTSKFSGADKLCDGLRNQERTLGEKLRAIPASGVN